MEFTPQQQQAVENHTRNLIVNAGAGSGKTRVLVERYLALLAANPTWALPELVAITFTEKAAREMRDRVRHALQGRIQEAPNPADQRRWQLLAAQLDSARIGTIHSLCAQILRANPAQVPVDPGFVVLDENESFLLRSEAVEQTLAQLVSAAHPASHLLLHYSVYDVRKVLHDYADQHAAIDTMLHGHPTPAALLADWAQQVQTLNNQTLADLREDAAFWAALDWQPHGAWATPEDKLMLIWAGVHQAAAVLHAAQNSDDMLAALEWLATKINLQGGAAKNWGGKEVVAEVKAVLGGIREIANAYMERLPRPLDALDEQAAELLFLWQAALNLTQQTYAQRKAEQAALDFNDLEFLTADLLAREPAVAARYQNGEFQHMMIDEFQDTNALQRDIIYRLAGDTPGRLFVVGDPKQSIYAFRGADVSVFNAVRADITGRLQGQEIPLSHSFRSHERLVGAFNRIFKDLMQGGASLYSVQYDAPMLAARPAETFHQKPLNFILLPKTEGFLTEDYRLWEAQEIAQFIHGMVEQGVLVYDKEQRGYRPFAYGDAAILFRSLNHAVVYEEVFKAANLPYVTLAGRGYYDRQEVWDLLNLLRALHNPLDDLALASVLRSPMFALSDDALLALRSQRDAANQRITLWAALEDGMLDDVPLADQKPLLFAGDCLRRLQGLAGRVTVDELLETALDETAYDAILTALPDGDRRRGNIDKLLQKARDSQRVSLGEFLIYMHELTSVEPREGEAAIESSGAVKIMSVHKSKGLEFPLVVLAHADWVRHGGGASSLLIDREMGGACVVIENDTNERQKPFAYQRAQYLEAEREAAENLRLLYVAMTRAQDYLLIAGRMEPSPKTWLHQLCTSLEITEHAGDYHYAWGDAWVMIPSEPPAIERRAQQTAPTGWDVLAELGKVTPFEPPLLATVDTPLQEKIKHLSVTQLEHLGSLNVFRPPDEGKRFFRGSVLHDAPPPVRSIQHDSHAQERLHNRRVGSVVHRALQVGVLPAHDNSAVDDILRAYAWNEGVTDHQILDEVVRDATRLLEAYKQRGEPDSLRHAQRVFREIPFTYQLGGRILHGIMDVLYQYQDQWYVLDYKTAAVKVDFLDWHARRYYLQLGAYAHAVYARTQQIPTVQIYYLHAGVLLTVEEKFWGQALANLDLVMNQALE